MNNSSLEINSGQSVSILRPRMSIAQSGQGGNGGPPDILSLVRCEGDGKNCGLEARNAAVFGDGQGYDPCLASSLWRKIRK